MKKRMHRLTRNIARKNQLLEHITIQCKLFYPESLQELSLFRVFESLDSEFLENYSAKEWNAALSYICKEEVSCKSMEEVKDFIAVKILLS